MNVDKIISALPGMSHQERDRVRANAEKLRDTGNADQKLAASKVVDALGELEAAEHKALVDRLNGLEISARVVEAFQMNPMSETEAKIIQVLLDNPGSTSTELSQALGWGAQSWHMHFGTMCANRAIYLWPAPKSEVRPADFYSGILADLSSDNRWTLKPDVTAALSELGLRVRN
ncbi:hypothetical protein [Novosphingobium meiothermophilum]|uniref:hypothetical protein n=1 Tax=Novosphingobium meiothermophilum TaxID=2202251 RepID=UPI000D6E481E|nr:hypothetical protein [Novosphingobium meiothermophilum]